MTPEINPPSSRRKVRALLLGDRIDTSGLERTDVLSTTPLAFRAGKDGVVTVFRYGVVVLFGVSALEERTKRVGHLAGAGKEEQDRRPADRGSQWRDRSGVAWQSCGGVEA